MSDIDSPVICLDFDGVLCDSIHECLIVAYSVFYNQSVDSLDDIPEDIKRYFYQYRYLVAPATDYSIIFEAFEKNIASLNRQRFNELRMSFKASTDFGQKFFDYRNQLRLNLPVWLSLHKLFPESESVKSNRFPKFNVMTTKDRRSVEMLSSTLGFADKISNIYSKEVSVDKNIQFSIFLQKENIDPEETPVIFVDDNIEHLQGIKDARLQLFHASWGYHDRLEINPFFSVRNLNFILNGKFYDETLEDTH
jgi:phosphoglycolate phosphatase-like HAD superfamily hydrolase